MSSSRSPIRKDGIAQSDIASQDDLRIVPRVVQSGDGRDESAAAPDSPALDPDTTSTSDPSDVIRPAARAVGPDDPTRTRSGDVSGGIALPPRPGADRLPAPLQYRDPERYQIVAEHGRGGLGRVYRARDKELGRDVALKELLQRGTTSELRFFREALITARLEHPGIVPVHEAGRWPDGTPFYAMKLVAGRPLKDLIAECKTLEERLALLPHVIAVADAIAYAHDRKIIHRDLKPSNIIVGDFGETVVIDWGLAKDIQADPADPAAADLADGPYRTPADDGVTVAGTVVGTPAYMSPEQARGEPVDERTDVYAIGAILYTLCTGGPPAARLDEAPLAGIDADLRAVVRTSLHPRAMHRYRSASSLARDLRQYAGGLQVSARAYSLPSLIRLWIRRNRRLAVILAASACAIAVVATWAIYAVVLERNAAERARSEEVQAHRLASVQRDRAVLAHGQLTLERDPTAAYDLLRGENRSPDATLVLARAVGQRIARATLRLRSALVTVSAAVDFRRVAFATVSRHLSTLDVASGVVAEHAVALPENAPLAVDSNGWWYVDSPRAKPELRHTARHISVPLDAEPQALHAADDGLAILLGDGRMLLMNGTSVLREVCP